MYEEVSYMHMKLVKKTTQGTFKKTLFGHHKF